MFVTFEEVYLRDLYEKGKTDDKKHRYQPDVIRRYQKCIDFLLDCQEGRRTSFDKFLEL